MIETLLYGTRCRSIRRYRQHICDIELKIKGTELEPLILHKAHKYISQDWLPTSIITVLGVMGRLRPRDAGVSPQPSIRL